MSVITIGILGSIGSGKDTIAQYLTENHDFKQLSFASSLKDTISAIFGWDRFLLEGNTKQSREWREQVDPFWSVRLAIPHLTPRWVLQYWGTEVGRKSFHNDIWVASLENKINISKMNTVISDCRFSNEIATLRKMNGIIVRVQRGEKPSWHPIAKEAVAGSLEAIIELSHLKIHESEWECYGIEPDYEIDNNGTLDQLYEQVKHIISAKR